MSTLMLVMSAKEAEHLTDFLGFRISHDTLLRVLQQVLIPRPCAEVIGIDDFAFKKGHRYGTIICDATIHRPINLLRTYEADALTDWLVNLEKGPVRASADHFPAYPEALLGQGIVVVSLNWRTVKKYSDPAYEPSPPKRQRSHLIDRFMPHLREYV